MVGDNPQKAENKEVKAWLADITEGRLQLPNFQRQPAWKEKTIKNFLAAIYNNRPLGVLLLTGYDPAAGQAQSQLKPRPFNEIPSKDNMEVQRLLLDGQQRLTALWKVFNDGDDAKVFCIQLSKNTAGIYSVKEGEEIAAIDKLDATGGENSAYKDIIGGPQKWLNKEDSPKFISLSFFNPEKKSADWEKDIGDWLSKLPSEIECPEKEELQRTLNEIRKVFSDAWMPYFLLPVNTTASEAADIFMGINTGSVKLTAYDIAVADIEKQTGKYIEDIADSLKKKVTNIEDIDKDVAGELILKIACVIDGKSPSGAMYTELNYENIIFGDENETRIIEGVNWTVELLADLKILNGNQMPSVIPLRVLPALHEHYKKYVNGTNNNGKERRKAKANKLIKRYLWHAFLTDRYTGKKQVNDRLKDDYDGLYKCFKAKLKADANTIVPIFKMPPVAVKSDAKAIAKDNREMSWPKKENILARGILLACIQTGAHNPISGGKLRANNVMSYHHIFPRNKLKDKDIKGVNPNLVLNCLYILGTLDNELRNDLPGTGLERASGSDINEETIKEHLDTHLLPSNFLMSIKDDTHNTEKAIKDAYQDFLEKRAKLVNARIKKLLKNGEI